MDYIISNIILSIQNGLLYVRLSSCSSSHTMVVCLIATCYYHTVVFLPAAVKLLRFSLLLAFALPADPQNIGQTV